jgi:hypothetical protein
MDFGDKGQATMNKLLLATLLYAEGFLQEGSQHYPEHCEVLVKPILKTEM